jgi:predicted SnoaL-like aldol condensation-catalyzing enzyme
MSAKKIVQNFYKSDALIDAEVMKDFLHPEIILEWNSSKGLVQMNYNSILDLANQLNKAYVRSKVRISHLLSENDLVSVRYSHYVKTIENPSEELFLANFIVIWQIKDNKLFRGYQMSQIS